jgi:hypothetical protein
VALRPFSFQAIQDMLRYRIRYASKPVGSGVQHPADHLITPAGWVSIFDLSGGRPREALKVAARSLYMAAMLDTPIDEWVVKRANRRPWWRRLLFRS